MSLLKELQDAAVDSTTDLGALLRKCKVLGARLGSKDVEDWLLWESNGYPDGCELPNYRIFPLNLKGHFVGNFGSQLRNASIPSTSIDKEFRENYRQFHCRQSVSGIEDGIRENATPIFNVNVPPELAVVLGTSVYKELNCVEVWGEIPRGCLVEVLNTVRNKVLDFALAIWKLDPSAGEDTARQDRIEPHTVSQVFNTTVYGGSTNVVGTGSQSIVTLSVHKGDFKSLRTYLQDEGITVEDIADLKSAIKSDPKPESADRFGPNVSSWIGAMVNKAASGAWEVGVSAAGSLLARAISMYYGS